MYKRYSLLKYLPDKFSVEDTINPFRIYKLNNVPIRNKLVVYLCQRAFRVKDNFSFEYAQYCSSSLNTNLLVLLTSFDFEYSPKSSFLNRNIAEFSKHLTKLNIEYEYISAENLITKLLSLDAGVLVLDFNPIKDLSIFENLPYSVFEVDSKNIVPARYISNKQEYNAAIFRQKVYKNIYSFFTEFSNTLNYKCEADYELENFIEKKLSDYAIFRNEPAKDVLSGLSKYLTWGFLSPQRVALSILKSDVDISNKEAFLEELIVRSELADNFCLYSSSFKTLTSAPNWARISLEEHELDFRQYNYSLSELEMAKTHDDLWNATQRQLLYEGTIHSYLRMYWAKKIMEWSSSAQSAINTAIYLNDKYAFDAPSPNGYVGILWAIVGLHDRPFQDWPVTGKVRRMTYASLKRKIDINSYISKYS